MKDTAFKQSVVWAVLALLVLLAAPFLIIYFSSATSLFFSLFLFLSAILVFFRHILIYWKTAGWLAQNALIKSILLIIAFLAVLNYELALVRGELLFGYKAVSNQLQPDLIDGDHYLADKWFYKTHGPQRNEVFVIRDNQDELLAGRLLYLPGEHINDSQQQPLGEDEYAFSTGKNQPVEIIGHRQIQARALFIYGSYDPLSKRVVWERTGKRVN